MQPKKLSLDEAIKSSGVQSLIDQKL